MSWPFWCRTTDCNGSVGCATEAELGVDDLVDKLVGGVGKTGTDLAVVHVELPVLDVTWSEKPDARL